MNTKERPVLFSSEMVRAILDGRKTQTRRILKPQPPAHWQPMDMETLIRKGWRREYAIGRRLWVRETWKVISDAFGMESVANSYLLQYAADNGRWWQSVPKGKRPEAGEKYGRDVDNDAAKWRPSIFMPRWASRVTLEVTAVRVERVQDISREDVMAEGLPGFVSNLGHHLSNPTRIYQTTASDEGGYINPIEAFENLWNKINGKKHPWESNPWVWVVEFKRVQP